MKIYIITDLEGAAMVSRFRQTRGCKHAPELKQQAMHFLTADRKGGGHVLDFVLKDGSVEIDQLPELLLILPNTETFQQLDLSPGSPDAIQQVEGPH